MNSAYIFTAICFVLAQSTQAYFPYAAYLGAYPELGYHGLINPFYGVAPYANYYGYPYDWNYYHPRTALRNTVQSFRRENAHLSDTSLLAPFHKKN